MTKRSWGALLAADLLVLVLCVGGLGARVLHHIQNQPAAAAPAAAAPESPAEPSKTEAPPEPQAPPAEDKPAPAAPSAQAEPAKPEPAKPADTQTPEPKSKLPVGSPAVNAPSLPQRTSEPAKPEKPAAKAQPDAGVKKKERTTRPVTFTHVDTNAKEVSLVGAFLISSGGSKRMFRDSKGRWEISLYLNIGYTYRYQYMVIDDKGSKKLTSVETMKVDVE